MDFFGFGSSSDLSTPIGQLVKSATDPLQLGPDWSKNLDICDQITHSREGVDHGIKAMYRRLNDSDQNTVYLALILLETCLKNCGPNFTGGINKTIMDSVEAIAKGSKGGKNADEALRLIQQWGRAFEKKRGIFPIFFDTYMAMKSRGVRFPKEEESSIAEDSHSGAVSTNPAGSNSSEVSVQNVDEFTKLESDLNSVMEKVRMCREMLFVSAGIAEDETLADVIGFLEAVRDRMGDLIDAGTQGVLGEELFALCLKVNEAVYRTLEAERNGEPIPVDDENKPATEEATKKEEQQVKTGKSAGGGGDLLDMDFPSPVTQKTQQAHQQQPAAKVIAPPVTSTSAAADFDAFLSEFTAPAPAPAPISTGAPSVLAQQTPFDDLLMPAPPPATTSTTGATPVAENADKAALDAFFDEKW